MDHPDSLHETFWRHFSQNTWEQKTTHQPFSLAISEADLFEAMLQATEVEHQKEQCTFIDPYRVAVDGCHILDHDTFSAFLPFSEDQDLDGFIQRMDAQCDLDMSIQVTKISTYSPVIWQRVRAFLQPFLEAVGVIPETIEIDLFVGKYAQTHFGVHRDADSTFTFGFRGEKQFRMWPLATFTPEMAIDGWPTNIQDKFYQQHRDQAQVVTVAPGSMLYWPSSVWHVGESPHRWSITLAVALHLMPDPYERIKAIMSALLPNPRQEVNANAYACDIEKRKQQTPALPEILSSALKDIRQAAAAENIDLHLSLEWLKQASGGGLTATPPTCEPLCFSEDRPLQIHQQSPLLWNPFSQDRIVIAANGYGKIFSDVDTQQLIPILESLNRGETISSAQINDSSLQAVMKELSGWYVFVAE